jgi:hypothetical protein
MYGGIPAAKLRPLSRMRERMTTEGKMKVIAKTLSSRLIQAGWLGEAVEAPEFRHPYRFRKGGRGLTLVFVIGAKHSGIRPEPGTVIFTDKTDPEWISRAADGSNGLIVDVSAKRGTGDRELEFLVLNLLQDCVFRFYAEDDE